MINSVGLVKTTLVDYPGHVAATVFTHGCPLRCPYCHNPELVRGPTPEHFLPIESVLEFLARRRHLLQGVCLTGGEPLVHQDLPEVIGVMRGLGYSIKLDTCGMFPEALARVLDAGVVDMVALDIKTAFHHYDRVRGNGRAVREALSVLRDSGVPYELRTTVVPGIVEPDDLEEIRRALLPSDRYVLTQFRPASTLDAAYAYKAPYAETELRAWRDTMVRAGLQCSLRGL